MKPTKDVPAAPVKTILLPSLPKCDEANRSKWMQEYDRVEGELLKSHMQGTATLGLRQLPSQWDRSIPPPISDDDRGGPGGAGGLRRPKSTIPTATDFKLGGADDRASPRAKNGARPRSAHRSQIATSSLSSTPAPASTDPQSLLRVLFTIVDPPVQYRSQLDLDLRHIDLRWLSTYVSGDRTPTLNTLETLRDDDYTSKNGMAPLNSPRSVLVLLRNGVSVDDLQVWPIEKFSSPGASPEMINTKAQHREDRRVALLTALRDEYRELSSRMSLFDLIDDITNFRHHHNSDGRRSPRSTNGGAPHQDAAKQRREEHERALAHSAELRQRAIEAKHERAARLLEEKQSAHAAAVALRRAAEEERRAKLQQSGGRAAHESAADGGESDAEGDAAATTKRLKRVRSPGPLKATSPTRHQDEKKSSSADDHALRLLRNTHRMKKNRELVEEQRRNAEQKQEQREAAAALRRQAAEAEQRARQQERLEQRMHSEQNRAAAREKALQLEQAAKAEAEARAQRAAERLQAFASYKAAQSQQNSLAEQERRYHQNEAARRAEERRNAEARRLQAKQEEEAERLAALNRTRELTALHARLQHQVEQDDKIFFVERQRKAQTYEKLLFIADLEKKKTQGESVLRARSPR